jgi:hypothetical protein
MKGRSQPTLNGIIANEYGDTEYGAFSARARLEILRS